MELLSKYDLTAFLEGYLSDNYFPNKLLWRKIVCQTIEIHEDKLWRTQVEHRKDLIRYSKIHTKLTEHRLLRLSVQYPKLNEQLMLLVKLGSLPIKKRTVFSV